MERMSRHDARIALGFGLSERLSQKQVRTNYGKFAKECHPDLTINNGGSDPDRFRRINLAYRILNEELEGKEDSLGMENPFGFWWAAATIYWVNTGLNVCKDWMDETLKNMNSWIDFWDGNKSRANNGKKT